MSAENEKVRLILGLKVKQLRLEKGLSQHELSQQTGLAHSYLNEIEKGKKYPKADKMMALAQALGTDYDSLVSLKLDKKLEPITELLNSRILSELPLDMFGLDASTLLQLMSEAPAKLSAFVNTLIELSRSYDMRLEQFYFSVLRTYQEMHDNYFADLEEAAEQFLNQFLQGKKPHSSEQLKQLLAGQFGYQFHYFSKEEQPAIGSLRSVFRLAKGKQLWLNDQMTESQLLFTLARECGYQFMKTKERPLESSVVEPESFEHTLNNFRASYFARAVLVPRQELGPRIQAFFAESVWNSDALAAIQESFHATPEMFLHRLINVLVSQFGLTKLFFIRLDHTVGENRYRVAKELRLSNQHSLPGPVLQEHYCRRWVSITVLQELAQQLSQGNWNGKTLIRTQKWQYVDTDTHYWVVTLAKPSPPRKNVISSVSLGIEIDENLRQQVAFLLDPAIGQRVVGETCERCPLPDCAERVHAPTIVQQRERIISLKAAVATLGQ